MTLALLALTAASALAHGTQAAAFEFSSGQAGWTLEMHFPQLEADTALGRHLGQDAVAALDEVAYKQALIDYLRATVRLTTASGRTLDFQGGGIRLDAHQTDVRFVYAWPDGATTEALHISLACFSEDPSQANVLRVSGERYMLNLASGYSAMLPAQRAAQAQE